MVWIKGALDEYINLDKVKAIYVRDADAYDVIVCFDQSLNTIAHKGNGNKEDSLKFLDELMKKIK